MAIRGNPTLCRGPELEPHHQIQFSAIPWIPPFFRFLRGGDFPSAENSEHHEKGDQFLKSYLILIRMDLGLVSLFNGISTFVGYLMPSLSPKRTVVVLFNP